jgi:hypothetical protein
MGKNEVLEAVIKDGRLYCGKCGKPLGRIEDYCSVDHFGERLILFTRYCTKKGCIAKSNYQIKLTLDDREVFNYPLSECKKIKSERVIYQEEDI